MRFARTALLVALAGAVSVPPDSVAAAPTPASALTTVSAPFGLVTSLTPVPDTAATARLRAAADRVRTGAGNDALWTRSAYATNARRIATAAANRHTVTPPGDDAPIVHVAGTTTDLGYTAALDAAIGTVVRAAGDVLRYPMHTDGGWSVMVRRQADGRIAYGVGLVVGWPAPPVSASRGCNDGYCWSNSGLHPHLPWTRNTVKVYLSTANLPTAGESLVKAAIAKLDAVPGFGADLVYAGRTSATGPTATRRFVVVFSNGCSTPDALGCTITSTQGTYRFIFQAKTIATLSRYRANPDRTWWIGTLMHEIAHAVGLGHFDSRYNGSYQLMRSASGPDTLRSGDGNGLRRIAPGGRVSASLTARESSGRYALVVRTANAALGGIRAIRTQCTDATGTWRTVGVVSGTYDTRSTERTVGSFDPPAGATRSCRAIVRSKTRVFTTATVAVRG